MQVHPVEVWDLLDLLGLPPEWDAQSVPAFFEEISHRARRTRRSSAWRACSGPVERCYGPVAVDEVMRPGRTSASAGTEGPRGAAGQAQHPAPAVGNGRTDGSRIRLMRPHSPIGAPRSRHTRELLRRYFKAGKITTPIADREVEDRFIDLSPAERRSTRRSRTTSRPPTTRRAPSERNAVGFVMTIYRRRLASSFHALGETLEEPSGRHRRIGTGAHAAEARRRRARRRSRSSEALDADEAASCEQEALVLRGEARHPRACSTASGSLPPDTKARHACKEVIADLRARRATQQVMVFTQYTDTMDFLRDELRQATGRCASCASRAAAARCTASDGAWRRDLARRGQAALPRGRGRHPAVHRRRRRGSELPVLRRARSTTTCRGTRCGSSSASGASTASVSATRDPHRQPALRRHGRSRRVPGAARPHRPVRDGRRPPAADPGTHAATDHGRHSPRTCTRSRTHAHSWQRS